VKWRLSAQGCACWGFRWYRSPLGSQISPKPHLLPFSRYGELFAERRVFLPMRILRPLENDPTGMSPRSLACSRKLEPYAITRCRLHDDTINYFDRKPANCVRQTDRQTDRQVDRQMDGQSEGHRSRACTVRAYRRAVKIKDIVISYHTCATNPQWLRLLIVY